MNQTPTSPLPKVLIIGDSISIGYFSQVQSVLDGHAVLEHNPGNSLHTRNGLVNLDAWLGDAGWSCILFNFGLHEIARDDNSDQCQISRDEYRDNLKAIVARLKKTNAALVWARITPVPPRNGRCRREEDVRAYNKIADAVMEENGIDSLDLHAIAAARIDEIQQPDDVHFNAEGNQVLGNAVGAAIAGALGIDVVDQEAVAGAEKVKPVLLFIGDSNGEGLGGALQPLIRADLLVFGQPGMTVGFDNLGTHELNMLRQIDRVLGEKTTGLEQPVREVVVMLGTNDCKVDFKDRQDEVVPNFRKLVERLRAFDWPGRVRPEITLVTPPPFGKSGDTGAGGKYDGAGKRAASLVPALKSLGDEMNVRVINAHKPLVADIDSLTTDGVHFTPEGYGTLAGKVAAGLDADLRKR